MSRLEGQGQLSAIGDRAAAEEIRKLWTRANQPAVTQADLALLERRVLAKVAETQPVAKATTPIVTGASSTTSGGSLSSNNQWTGLNSWVKASALSTPPSLFQSLNAGALLTPGTATILGDDFDAAVSIEKSTITAAAPGNGGHAGLYIRHRANASMTSANTVVSGLRAQVEAYGLNGGSPINTAVAGYFGLVSGGTNMAGHGVHIDLYHLATGASVSEGLSIEAYGQSTQGTLIGAHVRSVITHQYQQRPHVGFLCSGAFDVGFAVGSALVGGNVTCRIGLDLSLATITEAAIRLPTGSVIAFGSGGQGIRVISGTFQTCHGAAPDGAINVGHGLSSTHLFAYNARTQGAAGNLIGYWEVFLGGFRRLIPFYAQPTT